MLQRLAKWLALNETTPVPVNMNKMKSTSKMEAPSQAASSTESQTNKMLITMHQTIMALKEEVAELKEESEKKKGSTVDRF
eukprot:Skav235683  [mRNA]  locus=scaffold280:31244:31486:- [translate_table: standard]